MIGEIISNYKIISVIGEGGMGTVYLAEHIHIGRKAAIKVLHKKYLSNSNIKERFKHEAATLSNIQHPNIVKLYDYVETKDGLYLIMEYADGVLLDDYIKKESGPIKEENAIKIMNGLLSGFAYAHSQNIVHRDVKPNNVIISRDFNTVKILDFGIAKIINDNSKNLTKDGTQMGTVYYMSPEQVRGQKIDNRSDIYSLGVTLFQIVTGINPYEKITTEYEIYSKITQEELQDAKSVYPYISDKIEAVIKKATRKNPADRYQNCEQMLADLNSVKTIKPPKPPVVPIQKPVQHPIHNPVQQKPITQQPVQPIPIQEPIPQKKENNNLVFGLVGGLIVVCIIVGFIFKCQHDPPPPPPPPAPDTIRYNQYNDTFVFIDNKPIEDANGHRKVRYIDAASKGDIYDGEFKNNLRNGLGIYIYAKNKKDKYISLEGNFSNNLMNGIITFTKLDGTQIKAECRNDTLVKWIFP